MKADSILKYPFVSIGANLTLLVSHVIRNKGDSRIIIVIHSIL